MIYANKNSKLSSKSLKMLQKIIKLSLISLIIISNINYCLAASSTDSLDSLDVFQKYKIQSANGGTTGTEELTYVNALPDSDYKTFSAQVIRLLLGFVSTLCFVSLSVAGVMFVLSPADSEMQGKAKNILKYSAYGILVIALSYAIVYGIARLDFD